MCTPRHDGEVAFGGERKCSVRRAARRFPEQLRAHFVGVLGQQAETQDAFRLSAFGLEKE